MTAHQSWSVDRVDGGTNPNEVEEQCEERDWSESMSSDLGERTVPAWITDCAMSCLVNVAHLARVVPASTSASTTIVSRMSRVPRLSPVSVSLALHGLHVRTPLASGRLSALSLGLGVSCRAEWVLLLGLASVLCPLWRTTGHWGVSSTVVR